MVSSFGLDLGGIFPPIGQSVLGVTRARVGRRRLMLDWTLQSLWNAGHALHPYGLIRGPFQISNTLNFLLSQVFGTPWGRGKNASMIFLYFYWVIFQIFPYELQDLVFQKEGKAKLLPIYFLTLSKNLNKYETNTY